MNTINDKIFACVDHSPFSDYVTDYAAWACKTSGRELELLHVLENPAEGVAAESDLSGAIGIDAQQLLLLSLAERDELLSRKARERGRLLLQRLRERVSSHGVASFDTKQRRGSLEETFKELESSAQLFVLGRRGESASVTSRDLGRNVEWVVRALKKPVLAVNEPFSPPSRVLVAFDGSMSSRRSIDLIATSPMFDGLSILLFMAGEGKVKLSKLEAAERTLKEAGRSTTSEHTKADPERMIASAVSEHSIDLVVMGAWTHSPFYAIFFGSKTTEILRAVQVPTLLVR